MEQIVKVENNTMHPVALPEIQPDWPLCIILRPGQICDVPKAYFDAAEAQEVKDAYGRTFQPAKRTIAQLQETGRIYTNNGMRIGPQITVYADPAQIPERQVQQTQLPQGNDATSKQKAVEASLIIVRSTEEKAQLEYWLAGEKRSEVKSAIQQQLREVSK